MSLASWYVIAYKWLYIRRAEKESDTFLDTFWESKRLDEIFKTSEDLKYSPVSQVFRAGYTELSKLKGGNKGDTMHGQMGNLENIERALRRATQPSHTSRIHDFFFPQGQCCAFRRFIWDCLGHHGLIYIARNTLNSGAGIAEALVATAIGLVAAIPAVVAYNWLLSRMRVLEADMDNFGMIFSTSLNDTFSSKSRGRPHGDEWPSKRGA